MRNDVQAGMTVRATGDIEVGGVVEPATLEAGGSIVVKGGVLGGLGGKTAGKDYSAHAIRCGGSFCATYAQQARISAGDSIFIDDVAMQCQLEATNHIRVGKRRRGQIIGGHCAPACRSTRARSARSSRIRTELEIGMDPGLEAAVHEKAEARDALGEPPARDRQDADLRRPPSRARDARDGRTRRADRRALSAEIEGLRGEEDDLRHRLLLTREARVNAEREMFEGCIVPWASRRCACRRTAADHGAPGRARPGRLPARGRQPLRRAATAGRDRRTPT
jgi:hypothetical protein